MQSADVDRLVFLDESGFNTAMALQRGWSRRGSPLFGYRPINWGKNLSVVGAIRLDEVVCHRFFEGAINADHFVDFVTTNLCPRLRSGDVLVMDNLRQHKDARVVEALARVGATCLFLPPYSPEFNPIEPLWAFTKQHVRAVAARTADTVRTAFRSVVRRLPVGHLAGWFRHCGYQVQRTRSAV